MNRSTKNNRTEEQKGYRTAFKATSIFGGVQVVTILVGIVKSKLVAIWLGAAGFGMMSLFNAAINLISAITNLGLQSSAVRDIAVANGENDATKLANIVKAIRRWVWGTGLIGASITIALSPWLSEWLFESNEYVGSFIFLSSTVLLIGLYSNHYALLQGTRRLKLMASANVYGSIAGFVCSVPMFYFFREGGIVYALILTALSTVVVSYLFARKVKLVVVEQSIKESYHIGLSTVKLGIMMALSNIAVYLVQFVVKAFITRYGNLTDVGLYQAGWVLNTQYLGLVFTAMAKDYFPRLSQLSYDNTKMKHAVNQQAEIAVLILAPMVIGMIVFLPIIIKVLYSGSFMDIIPMTKWFLVGSMLKAGSWAISFVFLAKGAGKVFLFNELGIKCFTLPTYILGYVSWGLVGIGYAYTLCYLIYFVWVVIVSVKKYHISYSSVFWKLLLFICFFQCLYVISESYYSSLTVRYTVGCIAILAITAYSAIELKKRLLYNKNS